MLDDIVFGDEYKDSVTGFKGFVTSKHAYINGCNQVGLSPRVGKDNESKDALSFDVERIKRVGKGVSEDFKPETIEESGGPGDHRSARGPARR